MWPFRKPYIPYVAPEPPSKRFGGKFKVDVYHDGTAQIYREECRNSGYGLGFYSVWERFNGKYDNEDEAIRVCTELYNEWIGPQVKRTIS